MKENTKLKFIGEVRDVIYHKDGRIEDRGWDRNTMVNNFNVVISSLLKQHTVYGGIKYWAIGSGQDTWDSPPLYEKISIKFTSNATANGFILITLNNILHQVSITSGNTPSVIASKVLAFSFPGWNVELGETNDTVIFTATTEGDKVTNTYSAGTTGAAGILTVLENGRNAQPRPNPTVSDTGCLNEFYRKAIPAGSINFINTSGNVTSEPTNVLEVILKFNENEAVGKWREFCIFCGNATATLNSGLAMNRKTHGLIDKTSEMIIERTIRFTFL